MFSQAPAFNLKAVLKETGLAADTLRAWERRYGLPTPQRSAGGHRLYSQHDIEIIKWLTARQAEGLSISRAVDLWNETITSGADPLAGAAAQAATTPAVTPVSSNASLEALRGEWLAACLQFDEVRAEQTINQAFALFPVEAVCTDILQKGLAQVGALWYENHATVQQEHFASALAMRRIDALLAASPPPTRKQTVIIGCPANEWHAFMPLLLALFLRRRGLNVIYLGASVPTEQFAETATAVHADLVLLVAQTLVTAATLQEAARRLASDGVESAFGGRIFLEHPSLAERIPAHYLGDNLGEALETASRLVESKTLKVSQTFRVCMPVPQEYAAAHQFFTARRAEIELTLRGLIEPLAISPTGLLSGIIHLGNNIAAALQLGDMTYVSGEMEWLKTLMQLRNRPVSELIYFMQSYAKSVERHINGAGRPILDWLSLEAAKTAS